MGGSFRRRLEINHLGAVGMAKAKISDGENCDAINTTRQKP